MKTKYNNLLIGSAIYLLIALVGGICMGFYAGAVTKERSQIDTHRWLGCSLWWMAIGYMWLTWFTIYVFQLNPLLVPQFEYPFAH
jgi:hypothetical protein